jgi:hypothetical protein
MRIGLGGHRLLCSSLQPTLARETAGFQPRHLAHASDRTAISVDAEIISSSRAPCSAEVNIDDRDSCAHARVARFIDTYR